MQDDRRFADFQQAIARLEESLSEPRSGIVRDSSIKRFELCFELSWKVIQIYLRLRGLTCRSPRDCLKEAFGYGLLGDEQLWARMAQDRNLSVHTYNEELANQVYARLTDYSTALRSLCEAIGTDRDPPDSEGNK